MPFFVCQNEECGHRFFDRSQLAAMSGCPVCDEEIAIVDEAIDAPRPRGGATGAAVVAMDRAADARRDREQAASQLAGKIATALKLPSCRSSST